MDDYGITGWCYHDTPATAPSDDSGQRTPTDLVQDMHGEQPTMTGAADKTGSLHPMLMSLLFLASREPFRRRSQLS